MCPFNRLKYNPFIGPLKRSWIDTPRQIIVKYYTFYLFDRSDDHNVSVGKITTPFSLRMYPKTIFLPKVLVMEKDEKSTVVLSDTIHLSFVSDVPNFYTNLWVRTVSHT